MNHFDYKGSYRRNLPHIQPAGATLFITFRLSGSLPKSLTEQWRAGRKWLIHLEATNPDHFNRVKRDFERSWFSKFEDVLDGASAGPLWLGEERVANEVARSLHLRDGSVYRLDAFSIMPNHAHIVFKPLPINANDDEATYPSLGSIMQSLKGNTALACNQLLDRAGEFWAHESYDHYVRDHDEWLRIIAYVLNNPVKAGFVKAWQDWKWNYRRESRVLSKSAN
jgi:REP element-mobilizing transposase RayT